MIMQTCKSDVCSLLLITFFSTAKPLSSLRYTDPHRNCIYVLGQNILELL